MVFITEKKIERKLNLFIWEFCSRNANFAKSYLKRTETVTMRTFENNLEKSSLFPTSIR